MHIKEKHKRVSFREYLTAVLDFILISLAVYTGYALRLGFTIPVYAEDCMCVMAALPSLCAVIFAVTGQYGIIWEYAGAGDYVKFVWEYAVSYLIFLVISGVFKGVVFPRSSFAITFLAGLFLCCGLRISYGIPKRDKRVEKKRKLKTLIVGAGEMGVFLSRDLARKDSGFNPAGFIDDDEIKRGRNVSGLKVLGNTGEVRGITERGHFEVVLIAIPQAAGKKIREIYESLSDLKVQVRILPSLRDIADGKVSVSAIRKVKLEDLLGRNPVRINLDAEMNYIKDKRVLITGAGGSIGSEIVHQVLHNNPSEIIALGHGEQSIYMLREHLSENVNMRVSFVIADVADELSMRYVFKKYKPEVIFHAAAHKHVPLMEFNPAEAMRVNDAGTRNIARLAGEFNADRMVMISTDKAVNPSSVMGATKRLAEKILEYQQRLFPETKFMAVRFGNVLGSRGSVIPKFEEQIASGGPVTVTHPEMKRYFMLIPEAVSLVIQAGALGHGGELFVLDMGEPVAIKDMAELLIKLSGYEPYKDIDIIFTGIRPGEKLYEELFYDENAVHGTLHPKIFVSNIKTGIDEYNIKTDNVLNYALSHPDEALRLLKELVPEYQSA